MGLTNGLTFMATTQSSQVASQWSGRLEDVSIVYSVLLQIQAGAAVSNACVGIVPLPVSTSLGSAGQELAMEAVYSKHSLTTMGAQSVGQGKLKHYMSSSKILGVKRAALETEDNYSSGVATNPVNNWYWHVYNFTPGGETQSLIMQVTLTFYCVFEQRQTLAVS